MTLSNKPILVAPDSFKGTISASDVADAIGRGLGERGLAADLCPLGDGGEGTAAAVLRTLGGRTESAVVHDPLGLRIEAEFALLAGSEVAIVEVASASGLSLLGPDEYDAEGASTYGTGELIAAAVAAGAREVMVAAGGSATSDGGVGALAGLADAGGLNGASVCVLCDVRTPWERAAATFAPQKGADADAVKRIAGRLDALANGLRRDPRGVAMTGCAGGLSGALWAELGAELVPGAGWVMDAVRFDDRLSCAGALITGEGRLDEQSFEGKVCGVVISRASDAGVPAYAMVGSCALDPGSIARAGLVAATEAGTTETLEAAGAAIDVGG